MTEPILRITGRSSSHYTRVAAMFAHELGLAFTLEVVTDLASLDVASFGGNPALKMPTLHVGDAALFGTENICRRLVELAGRAGDPRVVLTEHLREDLPRNAQEMVWHSMVAQLQLRIGITVCNLPRDNLYFVKAERGMLGALGWLDAHLDAVLASLPAPRDISLLEVTLFCLLQHIGFRPSVSLAAFPRLRGFAESFALRESARRTPYRFD